MARFQLASVSTNRKVAWFPFAEWQKKSPRNNFLAYLLLLVQLMVGGSVVDILPNIVLFYRLFDTLRLTFRK